MKHLLFTLLGVLLAIKIDIPFFASCLLILATLYAAWLGRSDINILTLCTGLLFFVLVEQLIFSSIPFKDMPNVWINHRIYSIHFFSDLSCFFFLIYRGAICRWLFDHWQRSNKALHLTNADISMLFVMALFLLVDLAAMLENLLRNLEHLGFSEEFAKPLWQLNWIFYHYPQLKASIMGLQFLVLWSTVTKMAQKKSKLPGKLWA